MPVIGHVDFLQSLGWALLNSLWQVAFLWVIYQVINSFTISSSPARKSLLATLFLTGGFVWFIYTLFNHLFSNSIEILFSAAYFKVEMSAINTWLQSSLPVASLLYLLLLFIPLFKFARNYSYVNQLRSEGLSKIDVEWRLFVKQVAGRLGIRKTVNVYISNFVNSPVTIGFIKPLILLPMAAVNQLTPGQMEAILLHELAHIKRHDYLVNLWITLIQTILYFNPFVKLFIKQIEREREKSCDETVIHFQYDPHGYASALLMLEKTNSSTSIALAAKGKKNDLLHRIETILGIHRSASLSIKKISGIFAGLLCIVAIQALFIMSQPKKENVENFALLNATNPFYFFTGEDPVNETSTPLLVTNELTFSDEESAIHTNEPPEEVLLPAAPPVPASPVIAPGTPYMPGDYVYVNATEIIEPTLTEEEVEQVEEIVETSKEVLEKAKWNEIEENIADALTSQQKSVLQQAYLEELQKINWEKMEDRLRHSAASVDLENMNLQLKKELTHFKLDSLVKAYSVSINTLKSVEAFVKDNKEQEMIHPEISIPVIVEQRKALEVQLNQIKAIRDKKIIRL